MPIWTRTDSDFNNYGSLILGTNCQLLTGTLPTALPTITTHYYVVKLPSTYNDYNVLLDGNAAGRQIMSCHAAAITAYTTSPLIGPYDLVPNEFAIVCLVFNGTSSAVYKNDPITAIATGTLAAVAPTALAIGSNYADNTNQNWLGKAAYISIYDGVHTTAQRTLTMQQLKDKYGNLTPIDSHTLINWKMNESAAPLLNTGYGSAISLTTAQGAPTYNTAGLFDTCVTVSNAIISSGHSSYEPTSTAMTISVWVNLSSYSPYGTFVNKNYKLDNGGWTEPYGFILGLDGTSTGSWLSSIVIGGTSSWLLTSNKIPLNTWTLISMTYDNSKFRIYMNGIELSSVNATGPLDYGLHGSWNVGGTLPTAGGVLYGKIDDIRIENVARSTAYLLAMYNRGMRLSYPEALLKTSEGVWVDTSVTSKITNVGGYASAIAANVTNGTDFAGFTFSQTDAARRPLITTVGSNQVLHFNPTDRSDWRSLLSNTLPAKLGWHLFIVAAVAGVTGDGSVVDGSSVNKNRLGVNTTGGTQTFRSFRNNSEDWTPASPAYPSNTMQVIELVVKSGHHKFAINGGALIDTVCNSPNSNTGWTLGTSPGFDVCVNMKLTDFYLIMGERSTQERADLVAYFKSARGIT